MLSDSDKRDIAEAVGAALEAWAPELCEEMEKRFLEVAMALVTDLGTILSQRNGTVSNEIFHRLMGDHDNQRTREWLEKVLTG